MSKTEKATREYLETLSKDRVIELCLQFMFDVEVSELQLDQLKQQLAEKDKEIAHLKDFIGYKGCLDVIKKSNDNQTQLAIQELEKVKDYICDCTYIKEPDYTNVRRKIDNQIKELKGE